MTWRLEWRKMWWELIFRQHLKWEDFFQVLFRYEDPMRIVGRCWIGLACIPVWSSSFPHHCYLLPILPFQFGLYMSQTSLMLTPTMEGWQDRELDAKTSYLMDNVKYTSRGTFCPFRSFALLHYFSFRSWGLLASLSASFGHLLYYKNSAHRKAFVYWKSCNYDAIDAGWRW